MAIVKNITLNSQLGFWKGQKRDIRNGLYMNGRLVIDAMEWKLTLTKIQPRNYQKFPFKQIMVLQRKFKFYIHFKERVRSLKWIIQTICIHYATV